MALTISPFRARQRSSPSQNSVKTRIFEVNCANDFIKSPAYVLGYTICRWPPLVSLSIKHCPNGAIHESNCANQNIDHSIATSPSRCPPWGSTKKLRAAQLDSSNYWDALIPQLSNHTRRHVPQVMDCVPPSPSPSDIFPPHPPFLATTHPYLYPTIQFLNRSLPIIHAAISFLKFPSPSFYNWTLQEQ